MKYTLTRMAVILTALYWAGGLAYAVGSAAFGPQSGILVFDLYELAGIVLIGYSIPLTVLLWISWAIIRLSRRAWSVAAFAVYGIALPFLYLGAMQVPGQIERGWHAHQLALARIETITDEPLFTEQAHLIGVRLAYRVSFPWGLSSLTRSRLPIHPRRTLIYPSRTAPSWTSQQEVRRFRKSVSVASVLALQRLLSISFRLSCRCPSRCRRRFLQAI